MKTITFLNHKGGVGKTTLAYHAAAGLALKYKTLLIDSDGQGSATLASGLYKEPCFYDLFVRDADFSDVIRVVPPERYAAGLYAELSGEFWVIPGNVETLNMDPMMGIKSVRDRLLDLEGDVDVVIVDTSPTPSKLHAGIYMATDYIIHPTELEFLSTDGLLESIKYTDAAQEFRYELGIKDIEVLGIVPNKFRVQSGSHVENLKKLKDRFGNLLWDHITMSTSWADAGVLREPVFKTEPNSRAAKECWAMIDRIEAVIRD